ncbi:Hsp70 family protein [Sphingomonas sanxanigenens]|uniref:Molecular chaperone Hsp70 n=1 Tax=Sphingomonas sanxanigenens DSM 19645 = NX02 TaxID=1123269 RepID=W0A5X3_9SPHN|nr:Hsp70 family protein [Sphingomonas sanxanigenens]AHE51877.1 molecular chaperone Hsp70 [Sphingomonas sanxanigenens DSM 19645 = NX02]
MPSAPAPALGLDFGTTNSVAAIAGADGQSRLVELEGKPATGAVFRSALCFWHDDGPRGGLAHEAGPWAIAEYLEFPADSRFIQSFKSVAASTAFEHATVFEKRFRFEDLGRMFLDRMVAHAGGALDARPARIVVGRPVEYVGARPDAALARQRYDLMFEAFGTEIHYVFEPLGAAFSYASRLTEPATILVADFGGGTSDFSVVRIAAPGAARRCEPLGSAGIGIAGDRFDYRIVDRLVLPLLGKGGTYRSFDKLLEIPRGWFADFADWSRLALMRNRKTLDALGRLQRTATDGDAIGRMIAVIENELGYALYDAVGATKRALSSDTQAEFRFAGGGLDIAADVTRADFEGWIAEDLARIEATVDEALTRAGVAPGAIDRVFLTGGSSLIPAIRRIFQTRFGDARIATGGELTSIAHGLALIGQEPDVGAWAA